MTNKEIAVKVLNMYGCCTSKEIAHFARLRLNESMTPTQAAGAIRPLIAKGLAANSKNDKNVTVYWLTEEGKRVLKEE